MGRKTGRMRVTRGTAESAPRGGQRTAWVPQEAVAELGKRLETFEAVLGVGFGELENEAGLRTGEAGLIVFVDEGLDREVIEVRKLVAGRVGGYRTLVRSPRTSFQAYRAYLEKNGVRNPERFDCLPDPFWLDASKIHRLVVRRTKRPAGRAPADPATAVFGEIFVIEDDGTLVANPGTATEQVNYQAIFVRFRQQFGDHYDFAYIHHDTASGLNAGGGVSPTLFNDVAGINHYRGNSYDNRTGWNTTKLQSYQAVRSFQMRRMLHETAHRWLAFANHQEGGAPSTNLHQDLVVTDPAQAIFHWGNWCDDENSCMDYDYFDWRDVAGGYQQAALTAGAAAVDQFRYFGLDLYLMGLLAPADTAPLRYLENAQDPDADGVYAATAHAVTVADIVTAHGARNPAAVNAQRVFHQAYILLTRNLAGVGDLGNGLVQTFDGWRRDFEQRFQEAVGSRAVIDTRLLHGNFSNLYIRDNIADNGTGVTTGVTWDSPDIWVRQADDNGLAHQDTDRSHDNYLHARVWNSSASDYPDVTVRFYLGNHAENLPGTDFEYPEDWRHDRLLGEATVTVPAGGSAVAKIVWPKATIPPATGWHPCLLVAVFPMEVLPATLHRRTQNKKLAQKNITIVGDPGDPEDGREFRFTIGRPSRWRDFHVLVVERVNDLPGLEVAVAPEAGAVELMPELSDVVAPAGGEGLPPSERLHPAPGTARAGERAGGRLYVPPGTWFAYAGGVDACWTTVQFVSAATLEIGAGLRGLPGATGRRTMEGIEYHVLPPWFRTAIRIPPARERAFQVVRARIRVAGPAAPLAELGARVRFLEYDPRGVLVGGVDYVIAG